MAGEGNAAGRGEERGVNRGEEHIRKTGSAK